MLKKLILLALVLALTVCMVVACGGPAETDGPETDTPETDAPETDALQCNGEDIHAVVVEEKAATCQERGYKIESCSICGEIISESAFPKAACTPIAEATCTADSVCSVCGDVIEKAPGHTFGDAVVVEATCLAEGSKTQTCSVCGEAVVEAIPMLAHNIPDENVTASTAASCVADGSKTGTCTLCNQEQTVVLPAGHVMVIDDISAVSFVDGAIEGSCANCGKSLTTAGEERFALTFDGADVASEIAALATAENGLAYAESHATDQGGPNVLSPRIELHTDATDGHTSVLLLPHNRTASVNFNGSLLADSKYTVISFDWRITKAEHTSNKIMVFGQADKTIDGVTVDADYAIAFRVDRSNGVLYTSGFSAGEFELTAEVGQWYKIAIVVDNEAGQAAVYIDGQLYTLSANPKWIVTADGVYSWRFGGVYNVYHRPEFDNFTVNVIK